MREGQSLMRMMMMMMITIKVMMVVMINLLAADCKKDILTIHSWFEFVLGSLPCSLRFFRDTPGLPLYSKTKN